MARAGDVLWAGGDGTPEPVCTHRRDHSPSPIATAGSPVIGRDWPGGLLT
jgi:hypothetical protein